MRWKLALALRLPPLRSRVRDGSGTRAAQTAWVRADSPTPAPASAAKLGTT